MVPYEPFDDGACSGPWWRYAARRFVAFMVLCLGIASAFAGPTSCRPIVRANIESSIANDIRSFVVLRIDAIRAQGPSAVLVWAQGAARGFRRAMTRGVCYVSLRWRTPETLIFSMFRLDEDDQFQAGFGLHHQDTTRCAFMSHA